jgi:hypothetical protein
MVCRILRCREDPGAASRYGMDASRPNTEFDRVPKILFWVTLAIHFQNLEMDLVTVAGQKQEVFNIDESLAIVAKVGAVEELEGKCSELN